jgi:hypothetical protein
MKKAYLLVFIANNCQVPMWWCRWFFCGMQSFCCNSKWASKLQTSLLWHVVSVLQWQMGKQVTNFPSVACRLWMANEQASYRHPSKSLNIARWSRGRQNSLQGLRYCARASQTYLEKKLGYHQIIKSVTDTSREAWILLDDQAGYKHP